MSNLQLLTMVCHEIETILEQTVLVGGCATELLLTNKGAPEARYTTDVDMLIEVVSLVEYYQACEQLKNLGFHENHEVICRWEKNGLILDFMPTDEKILGFGNPWYKDAVKHKSSTVLNGMTVYHISAPYFIATKLEAYAARGNINSFINTVIYEGKLQIDPANDNQSIRFLDQNRKTDQQSYLNKDSGIVFVPVLHDGNTQSSMEEVSIIKTLFQELMGKIYTDKLGNERAIDINDILIVAPYNQQVNYLQKALGEKARIGSVDKFQGQEAPIVFLSKCTSDANESPRGD